MIARLKVPRRQLLIGAGALFVCAPVRAATPALSIKVYKDPYCGCCSAWADRLKSAGFKVEIEERGDMDAVKSRLGVPGDLASCHTGTINGYVIEGHVPPDDIKRLVITRTAAKGLAVPGMPANSPGMEMPGEDDERYTVWLFRKDGTRTAFAQHGG